MVDKAVSELTDQTSVLMLAREVENIAAQTYVEAGGGVHRPRRCARPACRSVRSRPATSRCINIALGYNPVPLPFMPTALAIDPKGYVGAEPGQPDGDERQPSRRLPPPPTLRAQAQTEWLPGAVPIVAA